MKIRGQKVYSHSERLKKLSAVNRDSGCIEWTGCLRNGYGRLIIGSRTDNTRKSVAAHRLAYETHVGKIPEGMFVCHSCDNPKCINPDHLFVGTRQDNVDDRERKGRNNHCFKLTDEDVVCIRGYPRKNGIRKHLASKFGVSEHTIKDIRSGKARPKPPTQGESE